MGPNSLAALMDLPLEAIEFGASGGTNFAKLEILRQQQNNLPLQEELAFIGHSADDMVTFVNDIVSSGDSFQCNNFIVSGGVKSYLDGYYLTEKINSPAAFAMASGFLKFAVNDYSELREFTEQQIEGLKMAHKLLRIRK